MVRTESIIAPILRTVLDGFTSTSPTETVHSDTDRIAFGVPHIMNSVLSSFNLS